MIGMLGMVGMIGSALAASLVCGEPHEPHVPESGAKDERLHLRLSGDALYGIGGQSFLGADLRFVGGYALWAAGRATGSLELGVQLQYGNEPTWLAPWLRGVDVSGATHRTQELLLVGHRFHMGKRRRVELGTHLYAGLNHWLSRYEVDYPSVDVQGSASVSRATFVFGGQVELGYRFSRRVGGQLIFGAPIPTPRTSSYVQGLAFAGLGMTVYLR